MVWTVLLAICAAPAADKSIVEDPEALLQRIRSRTAEHLGQLPRYTCHEVINRLVRRGGAWNRQDTVELEVAFIEHQELFARPGEDSFQERRIDRMVTSGTINNGTFGTLVGGLFNGNGAEFKYAGTGKKDGHQTVRFAFRVALETSQFLVRDSASQAFVPYEGSVWVDSSTLDLVRLDVHVPHIPSHIHIRSIEEIMHYQVMQIGGAEFLLARKSEVGTTDVDGNYSLNLIELQQCREFKSDSTVKYGSPVEGSAGRDHQNR
jgi:hypothetical protein